MEENKEYLRDLQRELDEKRMDIVKLENESKKIKEKIDAIKDDIFAAVNNKLRQKWFLTDDYPSTNKTFIFGYCTTTSKDNEKAYYTFKGSTINRTYKDKIYYEEYISHGVTTKEALDHIVILSDEQANEINEAIAETIKGENSIFCLYNYLEEIYNKKRHEN